MKYCVYVSGEHVELARAELESLCRALPFETSVTWTGRLASVVGKKNPLDFLLSRAALIQEAGVVLAESNSPLTLFDRISQGLLYRHLSSKMSFAVRVLVLDGKVGHDDRSTIEKELGRLVQEATKSRVNLENPDAVLRVFLMPEKCVLCRSTASSLRPALRKREPGKKPFFHPSMMNAQLSRVMCNLVGMLPGNLVLDPFCGGGGILCEVAHIGAMPIGVDLNWKLLAGAYKNLSQVTPDFNLIQGDFLHSPVIACDCLVTDPPYGRASSTRGVQIRDLVNGLVYRFEELLRGGGENVCICGSEEMNLSETINDAGFDVGRHLRINVHSGLVREIVTVMV